MGIAVPVNVRQEIHMFWVALLAVAVAVTFSTIGTMSVWIKMFALGAKALLLIIGALTLWFIWKHFFKKAN
jgi:hypothetical protein